MFSFRHKSTTYRFGNIKIRLLTPRNLRKLTEQRADAKSLGISNEAFPLVGIVWPSGELMAQLVAAIPIEGKRILDLGCGMALASHLLNARGADISALDIHPVIQEYLELNTRQNKAPDIPFFQSDWDNAPAELGQFDLIIGSDILYEPRHVKHLPAFFERHLKETGEILLVNPDRGQHNAFNEQMIEAGYRLEQVDYADSIDVAYEIDVIRLIRSAY